MNGQEKKDQDSKWHLEAVDEIICGKPVLFRHSFHNFILDFNNNKNKEKK
jgi:hypothetical protein